MFFSSPVRASHSGMIPGINGRKANLAEGINGMTGAKKA